MSIRLPGYFAMTRRGGAIAALDGLRAIAIILVLFRHAARAFWSDSEGLFPVGSWDLATPMMNGWMGVDLFFALSGFLILHHMMRRWGGNPRRIDLRVYFTKRVLRIVPAYVAVLFIAAAGLFPYYDPGAQNMGVRISYHLLFLQDYLASNIVVPFWSLGVEEKFYILAPLLLIGLATLRKPAWQYGALGVLILAPFAIRSLIAWHNPEAATYEAYFRIFRSPFHACFDGLAAGALCALLYRDRAKLAWANDPRVARGMFWTGVAIIGLLMLPVPLLDRIGFFDKTLLQSVIAVGMGLIVMAATLPGGAPKCLDAKWLFVVAQISYVLYLLHWPLIPGVLDLAGGIPGYMALPPAAQFLVFLPLFLGISTAAALALHYAVEKPFLILKDMPRKRTTRVVRPPQLAYKKL